MFADVEILERIGEGGIADVFRATWRGRTVALKVLRDPDRPGLRQRFLREGRLLKRLQHPGLVRCFEIFEGEQPALALELLAGETLDVRVRRAPLLGDEAVLLATTMLRTLGWLHEQGIVHRDVKSSNIFCADDRRVVLLDLGLATDPFDPLTTTLGDVLGTHAYMAPEQIAGAESDHRVDLYSLGITLYEALSGTRPYDAHNLGGFLLAHRAGGATPIIELAPRAPVRLAELVERLMMRDPAARPGSAAVALALLTGTTGLRRELSPPPMVGRESLRGAVTALLHGGGGLLRARGELGSGLGAAARLVRAVARAEGVEFVTLRCRHRQGLPETAAALARELAAFGGAVGADAGALREGLAARVAEDGRFLFVVEDLDLAPEGVAELVADLAGLSGLATVVCGSGLGPVPAGREIELRPLRAPEVRALVAGMLDTRAVPPGLDGALLRVSGGLPAVVVSVLREQVEGGAVWCEGIGEDGAPRWSWDPATRLVPGEDTARLFERALRPLPDGARRLAEVLAVAGGPVPMEALLAAAGVDASGEDLGPLLRLGICALSVERGEEWVRMRRAVLEPIVAGRLSDEAQREIHLALAAAVAERPQQEWERRFVFLHGALGAHEPAQTVRLVEVGTWLFEGGRALEALEVLDAAASLPLHEPAHLGALALARGDALRAVGRLAEARAAMDAGRAFAEEAGDDALLRRVQLAQTQLHFGLGSVGSEDFATAARLADEEGSPRALLLGAEALRRQGDIERAAAMLDRCVARAAPGPVDRVAVEARMFGARLAVARGELGRAATTLRGVAAETRALDRIQASAGAWVALAEVHLIEGALAAAQEALRTAEDALRGRGLPYSSAASAVVLARLHLACGDADGAEAALRAHATAGERTTPWPVRLAWLSAVAALRDARGDRPAALAAHLRAADAAAVAGDVVPRALHAGMAAILTADVAGMVDAVGQLRAVGAPRQLAALSLVGALATEDPDLLVAAEVEARLAGDQLTLLRALAIGRSPEARSEAKTICRRALDGLFGPLRATFLGRSEVRWAFGEHSRSRRDTSA
ncbi:MAG: protein kinase domain-containing protein [Myxococcota bacterium]